MVSSHRLPVDRCERCVVYISAPGTAPARADDAGVQSAAMAWLRRKFRLTACATTGG